MHSRRKSLPQFIPERGRKPGVKVETVAELVSSLKTVGVV